MREIVLMSDPRVAAVPVRECGEPLTDLRLTADIRLDPRQADAGGAYARLRRGVADRVLAAQRLLPAGLRLLFVEGFRPLPLQEWYFQRYADALRRANPAWSDDDVRRGASRSLAPPAIGPHVCGAAVDVTLCTDDGTELPMGSAVNASPEESAGACYTDAPNIDGEAREHRRILAVALAAVGFVNYPTEWWHWSYGDRYWALATGAAAARYGHLPG